MTNCIKCGADLDYYGNECTPDQCSNEVNIKKLHCKCGICKCPLLTMHPVCAKCTKGYHREELRK